MAKVKWVVDLSVMARKMPMRNRREMMDIAKFYRCDVAVAASLLITEEIFAGSLDDEWQVLLKEGQKDEQLHKMKDLFYETLTAGALGRVSLPLKSYLLSGSADFIFPGSIGLFDSLVTRFLLSLSLRI